MNDTTTDQATCASCCLPRTDLKMPDSERYPGAVPAAVCADCPPLHLIELGAATLTDPTPAERAAAESVFRTVLNPEMPCRCSGRGHGTDGNPVPCHHGSPCDDECDGRYLHVDRYAVGLISAPIGWMDEYACSGCNERFSAEPQLPELPWGVIKHNDRGDFTGYELYDGIRHGQFNTTGEDE